MDHITQFVMGRVKGQRRRVGIMVGRIDGKGVVRLGWSRANFSAGDTFDPEHGLGIAMDRTLAHEFVPAPHSMISDLHRFQDRCVRYFKGHKGMSKVSVQNREEK